MSNQAPPQHASQQVGTAPRELYLDQTVEVRVRTRGTNIWVAGFIVGTLQFISKFACFGYEVEYRSPSGFHRQTFPSKDIRPSESNNANGHA